MASGLALPLDQLLFLLLLQTITIVVVAGFNITINPHCHAVCGDVSIPYPFGIGKGCYRDEIDGSYEIVCKSDGKEGKMMPFSGDLIVTELSLLQSQATMLMPQSYDCCNKSGRADWREGSLSRDGTWGFISATSNKFTAIGCNTYAYVGGNKTNHEYLSGRMTFCKPNNQDDTCTGTGCCQSSIPDDLDFYFTQLDRREANDTAWKYNPCGYAFVTDDSFKFNVAYPGGTISSKSSRMDSL